MSYHGSIFSWICVCASYRICHRAFPEFMWQPQHFNLEFKTNGRWVLFLYQRGWLPQFKANLKKTKTKARILKKYGVPFQLFRYRKHKVFAAGIAVSAVLLFYCSGFVWNIEVKGNSYLSEETILTFLQNENAASVCQKEISTAKNWKKNCVLHTVKSSGLR